MVSFYCLSPNIKPIHLYFKQSPVLKLPNCTLKSRLRKNTKLTGNIKVSVTPPPPQIIKLVIITILITS